VEPAALTTAGPYRLVRHPIYAAYLLAWCGGAIISAQFWLLGAVICMGCFYLSAAWQEERMFLGGAMPSLISSTADAPVCSCRTCRGCSSACRPDRDVWRVAGQPLNL